jgi:hypothetical protein
MLEKNTDSSQVDMTTIGLNSESHGSGEHDDRDIDRRRARHPLGAVMDSDPVVFSEWMPKTASLRNLRPWKPGQSGNPNGRSKAPRFTERDQHAILTALAGAFGEGTQRAAIKAMQAVLTNPRMVLKALELCARLNGKLDAPDVAFQEARTPRCASPGSREATARALTSPRVSSRKQHINGPTFLLIRRAQAANCVDVPSTLPDALQTALISTY